MMRRIVHRLAVFLTLFRALLYGAALTFATDAAHAAAREPHIALILPLTSPSFGRHADAVRLGFAAGARAVGKNALPFRVYTVNEDTLNVLTIYEQAIESGAQLVVGPLTRSGVAAIAAAAGILPEQVCAVGDDVNDLPMIRAAGLGIAMGNALPEVQAAADLVVSSHDHGGIGDVAKLLVGQR